MPPAMLDPKARSLPPATAGRPSPPPGTCRDGILGASARPVPVGSRRKEESPRPPGIVEPRAVPAATRGQEPYPPIIAAITKTDSKTGTEHENHNTPADNKHLKILWALARPFPGMRMAVRMLSADVGWTWLCETVLKIDAGVPPFGCYPRLRCEREYQSPCSSRGSAGGMRAGSPCFPGGVSCRSSTSGARRLTWART
jgi:hypothetical protein